MSLLGDLVNGAKALSAHQQAASTAGRNLANVNNPGYARQRVVMGPKAVVQTPIGPQSTGLEALSISQVRDRFLDMQVTREISNSASMQSREQQLLKAQSQFGEQIDRSSDSAFAGDASQSTNGIGAAMNNFFNAFEELSARPADPGVRSMVLQRAQILAGKFNVTDSRLSGLQSDITAQVESDVSGANDILSNIARLNSEIATFEINSPGAAVDLRDTRQAELEKLAKFMDFTVREIPDSHGQIEIVTHDSSSAEVSLVTGPNVTGPLALSGGQITGGYSGATLSIQSGSIAGNLRVRDEDIQSLRNSIKAAADQLTAAVNGAYNPTGTTGNFFQTGALASGIINLDPSLTAATLKTSDSTDVGANDIALAVARIANATFSAAGGDLVDGTLGGQITKTVTGLGEDIAGVHSTLGDQQVVEDMVRRQRDAVSGVSMDEELADMMKFQRAFQAAARVVTVMDDLLDTVVNGLGR